MGAHEVEPDRRRDAAAPGVRVFLVDDQEVVRRGVRAVLETADDIVVVGEAATAAAARSAIPDVAPDVAVLDVRLPDGSGAELTRDLRAELPQLACLILTSYPDDEALVEATLAGAAGYVLKQISGNDLVTAIRRVASGQSMIDPATTAMMMARLRDADSDPLRALSEQERKVLELVGEGLTNRQIGDRLHLAEKTVKNYVSSVLAKLGLERRTQAAVLATRIQARSAAGR